MTSAQPQRERHIEVLTRLAVSDVLEQDGLEAAMKLVSRLAGQALDVGRLSIWTIDQPNSVLKCLMVYDLESDSHGNLPDFPLTELAAYQRAMIDKTVYAVEDVLHEPGFGNIVERHYAKMGITSSLSATIHHDRRFYGVVHAGHTGEKKAWTSDEESFISAIATVIANLLEKDVRLALERDLKQREQYIKTIVSTIQDGLYMLQNDSFVFVNEAACEIINRPESDLIGKSWHDAVHPADLERIDHFRQARLRGEAVPDSYECRIQRPDGEVRNVILSVRISTDYPGGPATIGTIKDLTDYRQLQEQLDRSERLKTIGQLTGGIAHDFNNILTIILGNAELGETMADGNPGLGKSLRQIIRAANRGAELTHRLLAFARQQPLHPVTVDLNALITGFTAMLGRTLGETITLKTRLQDKLWPTVVDPGQLENVLLNLCINARDAMPDGGRLSLESDNVRFEDERAAAAAEIDIGEYVVLKVSDSGCGMSKEVLEHAFEPFFTTKQRTQGTGLGLAMVYGFAKQSGGHVSIYSEAGVGTTIKLYLPHALAAARQSPCPPSRKKLTARGETILVVEDDADVRILAVNILADLGYEVLAAADGDEAIGMLDHAPHVHLICSDVILPGNLRGPDIAKIAQDRHPGVKVMLMSGYTAEAVPAELKIGSDVTLINKPFKVKDFAITVRSLLDEVT